MSKIKISLITAITIIIISLSVYCYRLFLNVNNTINNKLTNTPINQLFPSSVDTLDKIFSDNHPQLASSSANKVNVLIATGDIIPARSVNYQSTKYKNFIWPFEKTAETLKSADITLINLESTLIPDCRLTNEGMTFCGDTRHIEGLEAAGVDIASLENNHTNNYGSEGIENTVNLLKKAAIMAVRENTPSFIEVRNLRFAFLGYNDLPQYQETITSEYARKISIDIDKAKRMADVVIVSFHWGIEYTRQPTKRQRDLAHLAIDSGADLIIGNHPHWIQPVEIYKNKIIAYAHGNFIFDQMWSEDTTEGVVGRYTFYGNKLVDIEYLPIKIKNYGQPYFLEGEQKRKILNLMYDESMKLAKGGK